VVSAEVHKHETVLFFVLLQLAIIVIAGRIGGALARRLGQTAAVGEILLGILLGPSFFGAVAPAPFAFVFHSAPPEPMLVLSGLGLVLLMFQVGLEFDFVHLRSRLNRNAVASVSVASLLLPFALGLGFGLWSAPALSPQAKPLDSALFVATAFSITALPILGRIMMDFELTRTRLGVIAISAAAINDVVGWLLLALITTLVVSDFNAWRFGLRLAAVAAFGAVCVTIVRPLLKRAIARSRPGGGALSGNLLGGLLAAIFVAAMTTYAIGIFAIFGGFMLGVILFDEPELIAAWRSRVGDFVLVFFLPIFFTYTGLRTEIGGLATPADWAWCLGVVALASGGKLLGAYLGGRLSGLGHSEGAIVGFMMNTRALMELIVLNVGLDLGVISPKMFTMLVIMAIVSTVVTTPALRHYLRSIDLRQA
jgi:Kef-type K+ transport system membrane component KefB